jgi:hypothetical protein
MSSNARWFKTIHETLRKSFTRRTSSRQANSSGVPPPSDGDGDNNRANVNQFSKILGVTDDTPQTLAQDIGGIAYNGFKAVLVMLDRVGYALPPLKATASGLSSVMTMIDVCDSSFAPSDRAWLIRLRQYSK